MSTAKRAGLVLLIVGSLIAIGLGLAAWWLRAPRGTAPPRGATPTEAPTVQASRMNLTARMPLSTLQAVVEDRVPEILVDETGKEAQGDWRYDLEITRDARVSVQGDAQGRLVLGVPLTIDVKTYRGRVADRRSRKGKDAPKGVRLDAGLRLDITLDYRIADDWTLDPEVAITHAWDAEPKLKLGPLSFKVRKPVEKALVPRLVEAAAKVEADMKAKDELRQNLARAWGTLATPRRVDTGGWLVIEPHTLSMANPTVVADALQFPIGLTADIRMVSEEPMLKKPGPLPPRRDPRGGDGVRIDATVGLGWSSLEAKLRDALTTQTWESDYGTVRCHDVQLYPSADRIALGLKLDAESAGFGTAGWVWFLGRPVLDSDARTVALADFDYVVEAGGGWVETANQATLRDTLKDSVGPTLVFPWGEAADTQLATLNRKPSRDDGLSLHLDRFEVHHVGLTDAALEIHVSVVGTGELEVRRP